MSRAIKFRAWNIERKKYFNIIEINTEKQRYECNGHGIRIWPAFEECILEQYTGLKDKNGKEIYEGDLLRTKVDDVEFSGYIKFSVTGYVLSSYGFVQRLLNKGCDLEIIGNIHEAQNEN